MYFIILYIGCPVKRLPTVGPSRRVTSDDSVFGDGCRWRIVALSLRERKAAEFPAG
jgi:hypothetical protein